jgi:hypothetical protein
LLYTFAAIAFVVASVGATNVVLFGIGRQGVGKVFLESCVPAVLGPAAGRLL